MATLDEITSGALRGWLDGPCAVEITSITRFNVPGAEVALSNPRLDPGFRETLEEASGPEVSSITSTHARWTRREVEAIALPELSLSIPEMGTLRQVFSLATASRAGGRRRR
ncbi:MAG: hypothetical protein JWM18_535 [Chloroflexi bacterium]|jgi:hypothetical protein|nr:hypothetical protein [Chloroflexota bacterium]